jgi:membrane glycosyltransferase
VVRLLVSALLEFLHSLLLAPVRMLFHTQFFMAALTGWKLDWKSPPRGDDSTSWGEATRRHGVHTLFALAWIGAIHATGAPFPLWLSPTRRPAGRMRGRSRGQPRRRGSPAGTRRALLIPERSSRRWC